MSDQFELEAESAVLRLTEPWTDVVTTEDGGKYTPIDHPALLDMLNQACRGNDGGSDGGRSHSAAGSRWLIDVGAVDTRERIDGIVRATIGELSRQRPESELKAAVKQLGGILKAHHAARTITDERYRQIARQFSNWCKDIWRIFDPPVEWPLDGPCMECDETHALDREGKTIPALLARTQKGSGSAWAECRSCGRNFFGVSLVLLGRHIGATQDEDVIKAAGYDTPEIVADSMPIG